MKLVDLCTRVHSVAGGVHLYGMNHFVLVVSCSPLIWLNSLVTLRPNSQPAPRGDTAQVSMSSGSLHIKSQNGPS
jgi:hypothetical protein